jgi:CheY-like chemotaxis protein
MPAPTSPTREAFADWVHDALNHLYDSPYLQTHPLAELLVGPQAGALPRSQRLRRLLLDAIQTMRPEAGVPAQSSDWRAYRILELRYLEALGPTEVMHQLALGKSQYFREQGRVLDALTAVLWDKWQAARAEPLSEAGPGEGADATTRETLARSEAERLYTRATWEAVDVAQLLNELRTVVEPLAQVKNARVRFPPLSHLTVLRADRVMLRQALLNVITYALDIAREAEVEIDSFAEGDETGMRVRAKAAAAGQPSLGAWERQGVGLDICRQLMQEMGGALHLAAGGQPGWEARLAWPMSQQRVLLVVDDNQGFVDLFRRYLAAHHWQVLGAPDGATARQAIAETRPTVIMLDVMMPREDGWEFLMSLKANPETRDIPVIICSVLTEPQLALTLGAAAYLSKPVTQQALLQALAPWNPGAASQAPGR